MPAGEIACGVFFSETLPLAKYALHFVALVPLATRRIPSNPDAPSDFSRRCCQPMQRHREVDAHTPLRLVPCQAPSSRDRRAKCEHASDDVASFHVQDLSCALFMRARLLLLP